jgi:hypothetical protein
MVPPDLDGLVGDMVTAGICPDPSATNHQKVKIGIYYFKLKK